MMRAFRKNNEDETNRANNFEELSFFKIAFRHSKNFPVTQLSKHPLFEILNIFPIHGNKQSKNHVLKKYNTSG